MPAAAPSPRDFDEPKLEALIEAMLLAAHADEEFSAEERAHFTKSVESLTDGRLAGAALEALLARIEAALAAEGRAARLATVKARLADAPARKVALSLAVRLMAADGIVRTTEREAILEMAEALDIDRAEAADLVKSIAT
jgi:tellurite resistance protein